MSLPTPVVLPPFVALPVVGNTAHPATLIATGARLALLISIPPIMIVLIKLTATLMSKAPVTVVVPMVAVIVISFVPKEVVMEFILTVLYNKSGTIIQPVLGTTAQQNIPMLFLIPALGTLCLLYTSPSPRDRTRSRMPSSA